MKLDKNKPYGTVMGESVARFEQDGRLFDEDEDEIEREDAPPVKAAKAKPAPNGNKPVEPVEPVTAANEQLAAQVAE